MATKTLEIIIPHYKEPWSIVRPFFDMLRCQRGINFDDIRVQLIHDGEDPGWTFDEPYELIQRVIPHKGVSAARNEGLKYADSTWVTFCDCDDMYSSVYALKIIFDVLGDQNYDMMWSSFYIENKKKDDDKLYVNENGKFNMVWTHNKYYRLLFLRQHNLLFNEDLYMSEDSAFNNVLNLEIDPERIGTIKSPMPLYIWAWRADSVTLDPKNQIRNCEGHFERNLYVADQFKQRNHPDWQLIIVRTITDAYVQLTRKDFDKLGDYSHYEERIGKYIIEHLSDYEYIRDNELEHLKRIIGASESEAGVQKVLNPERMPLNKWVYMMVDKYSDKGIAKDGE